ncbi:MULTISPECIES: P-II family nitrogen regulator [unclassified Nitrosomonas]|uniref:P-II family nitrogen regulator n=1 Tax=unclassified Nitrosomonas TaxID=2609265 RepID=UPI00089CFAAD|nr:MULTISPECIES: P-II family nitrogen regulator [unclassified Nitrosomonas]MDV6345318.1 P-II family nitrogen regulator [Nitrosomonas sp. Is37]SDY36747.1 nitrogen regulatory protein P-II 1 [Nitrosomonas sp. Nm33]
MKEIRAYIQPFMLSKLTQTLQAIPGFPGMSISDCEGFGEKKINSKQDYSPYMPRKRIEIFAPDELVDVIFNTVMAAANTHQPGAGRVYIIDVEKSGHISAGAPGYSWDSTDNV